MLANWKPVYVKKINSQKFRYIVRDARRAARILGDGQKRIAEREIPLVKKLRYHEE